MSNVVDSYSHSHDGKITRRAFNLCRNFPFGKKIFENSVPSNSYSLPLKEIVAKLSRKAHYSSSSFPIETRLKWLLDFSLSFLLSFFSPRTMTMINDQACLLPIQPKRNPRSIIPPPSSFDLLFSRALGKVDSRCFYARGSQSETDPILISNLTAMQNRCSLETVTTFNFTFKRLVRRIGVGIGEGEIRQVSPISFLFLFILPSR